MSTSLPEMTQNLIELNLNSDNQIASTSPLNSNKKLSKAGNNYTNLSELVSAVSANNPSNSSPILSQMLRAPDSNNITVSSTVSISHSDFSINSNLLKLSNDNKRNSDIGVLNSRKTSLKGLHKNLNANKKLPIAITHLDDTSTTATSLMFNEDCDYYFYYNHMDEDSLSSAISFTVKPKASSHVDQFFDTSPTTHSSSHLLGTNCSISASSQSVATSLTPSKSENNIFEKNLSLPLQSFDVVSLTDLNDESLSYMKCSMMNDLSKTQILNRLSDENIGKKIDRY